MNNNMAIVKLERIEWYAIHGKNPHTPEHFTPSSAGQFSDENEGYVNSKSWALSALGSAGVVADETNVPGMDQLSGNRLDPDYFTANPDINDLTAENTNTNYCQVWDFEKKSCLSSPTDDRELDALDDDDDGDGVRDDNDDHPRDPSRS